MIDPGHHASIAEIKARYERWKNSPASQAAERASRIAEEAPIGSDEYRDAHGTAADLHTAAAQEARGSNDIERAEGHENRLNEHANRRETAAIVCLACRREEHQQAVGVDAAQGALFF